MKFAEPRSHGQRELRARSQANMVERRERNFDRALHGGAAMERGPAIGKFDRTPSQWAAGRQVRAGINNESQARPIDHHANAAKLPPRIIRQ